MVSDALCFSCPHCQHQYNDVLELLNVDELHVFLCEECSKEFTVLIKDCVTCGKESIFTWGEGLASQVLVELRCPGCGTLFNARDEAAQDD